MAVAWIGSLVAGSACGPAARPPERPVVTIRSAELISVADGRLDVRVEVEAVNPGGTALGAVAVDWELALDDRVRARGRADLDLPLAARGRGDGVFVGRVKPATAAKVRADRAAGAPFRVDGLTHWRSPTGDVATPFAWEEGVVPISRAAAQPVCFWSAISRT